MNNCIGLDPMQVRFEHKRAESLLRRRRIEIIPIPVPGFESPEKSESGDISAERNTEGKCSPSVTLRVRERVREASRSRKSTYVRQKETPSRAVCISCTCIYRVNNIIIFRTHSPLSVSKGAHDLGRRRNLARTPFRNRYLHLPCPFDSPEHAEFLCNVLFFSFLRIRRRRFRREDTRRLTFFSF